LQKFLNNKKINMNLIKNISLKDSLIQKQMEVTNASLPYKISNAN